MAHGLNSVIKRGVTTVGCKSEGKTGIGSRRIFAPHFKLQVLDSYRNDADCKGNQRATARKYGIHRRQIQKWLQVENTLRNSVNKVKVECAENPEMALRNSRQRDDVGSDVYPQSGVIVAGAVEARVPALSPVYSEPHATSPWSENTCTPSGYAPLDFTTHSRGHGSPIVASPGSSPVPVDPAAPIDLSFKRPTSNASGATSAPVPFSPPSPLRFPSPPSLALPQPHPDVWDLSVKRKYDDIETSSVETSPKPVKLFKPYLDDITENNSSTPPEIKSPLTPPCCNLNTMLMSPTCETYYYNNNNICEVKSDFSTYTLHELQPESYYYAFPPTVYPDYEDNKYCGTYELSSYGPGVVPLKQRQSYSLDFKLSAIDCYYQDSVCKGNQRAVATKYNIHRRQVQKWLKQAEELRQRNETLKQIHAVR